MNSPSRNQPCPCGSGKKFKHCCGQANKASGSDLQLRHLLESAFAAHQQGNLHAAIALYEKVLGVSPEEANALGLKGVAHYQLGDLSGARALIEQALRYAPEDARLHNYLGLVLQAGGAAYDAEMAFVEATRLLPNYTEAWHNAGKALLSRHKPTDALYALSNALRLAPNDGEVLLDVAAALFLTRKLEDAEKQLVRAKSFPEFEGAAQLWLSAVLTDLGRVEEAVTADGNAISLLGQEALFETAVKIGRSQLHVGNLPEAERWLNRAIAANPDSPRPYVDLAATRKFAADDLDLLDRMNTLLESAAAEDRRGLEFALGKIYTDLKDYKNSFAHYRAGNDLVRKNVAFDAVRHKMVFDTEIRLFTADSIAQWPYRSDSDVPILIVGTPRSGTTLVESIISSHSFVAAGGEMDFWGRVMAHVVNAISTGLTPEFAKRVADEYLMFMRLNSQEALRITDKMPGNFQYLGAIHAFFPKAKFVHIKRHPIDACLSIYFQDFPDGHAYKFDFESLVAWYEQYQRIMAHWRSVLPPETLYEIQYEDLVENQEGESRKLLEFLGLEWEEDVLDFHKKQDRAVFTASKWQVRQPVYKTSKERWRNYEEFIDPLLPLLKYAAVS